MASKKRKIDAENGALALGSVLHGFVSRPERTPDRPQRLSAREAKAILAAKGWSNRALALWWGYGPENISRIINNPERKRYFDDALRGLPPIEDVGEGGD
jgi:hypothetical protein